MLLGLKAQPTFISLPTKLDIKIQQQNTLLLKKPVYDWLLKIGPGGIRTHDQGIMSPLRYRCATSPNDMFRISLTLYLVKYDFYLRYSFSNAAPITPEKSPNLAFANLTLTAGVGNAFIFAISIEWL